jgi:hypothetical protein
MKSEGLAGTLTELDGQYQRLQLLVGELLLKNHELRCEVARLREESPAGRRSWAHHGESH